MTVRLSGVVTTLDNAATLNACLASLAFCDEIVLLDSGSTDATLDIARIHGARIASQPFAGYGAQKQAAIDLAQGEWILLLDADEHLTDAGRIAIERELAELRADGYRPGFMALRLLCYPALAFLKLYIGKRYFLNGWAGYFAARTQAFYAFLKYAKVLEAGRQDAGGADPLA